MLVATYGLMLRDVLGDGMPVGDMPSRPHHCDFGDREGWRDELDRWERKICPFLIRTREGLDAYLARGEVPAGAIAVGQRQQLDLAALNVSPPMRRRE